MCFYRKFVPALLLLVFLFSQNVFGEEKPLWELGAGVAGLRLPDYPGSDESKNYLLPYPFLIYRGDFLKIDRENISGRLFKTDRMVLDISLFGNVPVDSSKNEARSGMPDLDPIFQIGPSLNIKLLDNKEGHYQWTLFLPVRAVFSMDFPSVDHQGWVFSPRLKFEKEDLIHDSGLNLGISAGPMFATRDYHAYYYSVDPAYATPWRPAYAAESGYSGSAVTVSLNKQYKRFIFYAFVNADFLHGAAFENSPLVKTKNSLMYGLTVSCLLFKSKKLVTTEK